MNVAVIGLQFGDEGKGKIVDFMADEFDIIARFSGGSNAGHTVVYDGKTVKFHILPSGVLRGKIGVLGNGMVIDLGKLLGEIEMMDALGVHPELHISSRAHVVSGFHRELDRLDDEIIGIGTTRQGIGPAYTSKFRRIGIRVSDLYNPDTLEKKLRMLVRLTSLDANDTDIRNEVKVLKDQGLAIKDYVDDTEIWLNRAIDAGYSVLFEGAQGTYLDIDFGTYPYVTSSNTTVGGIITGLGISPWRIDEVVGVTKAYTTRVGAGPFPTEIRDDDAETLRNLGNEYGATTGRARRVGHLDMCMLRYAVMINGVTSLALTKVDVLYGMESVRVAYAYRCGGRIFRYPPTNIEDCQPEYMVFEGWNSPEDEKLRKFVKYMEKELGVRVNIISYGPDRHSTRKM